MEARFIPLRLSFLPLLILAAQARAQTCCVPAVPRCTAAPSSGGCTATLSAVGLPSATAGSGFVVTCSGVDAGRTALLFCGRTMSGLPWKPGNLSTLCMWPGQGRMLRCGTFDTGGQAGTCSGSFSLDFNTFMRDHPGLVGPDPWS